MTVIIPQGARTIAVVMPSWVGDAVMATPALRLLREQRPNAVIISMMRPGLDALLAGLATIDETVVDDMRGMTGPWRAARKLRDHEPATGVLLPNSFRSALMLRATGTRVRVGYDRDWRRMLLSHAIPPGSVRKPWPLVRYYLELMACALGIESPESSRLELAVTDAERAAADQMLHDVDGSFLLVNPGANKPAKRWPAARFGEAAARLAKEWNVRIVVTGSPGEIGIAMRVCESCAGDASAMPVNLVERGVTLGSLKAVMHRASLLITNDTGPRHIAAALDTPIVSLFGPTDHRWTLLPQAREHMLLAEPYLPEDHVADAHPQACDIGRIAVGDVVAAGSKLLSSMNEFSSQAPGDSSQP